MIEKEKIEAILKEELDEDMFLVEVRVSSSNLIGVFVDSYSGITIDTCISLSRHLEKRLDRDKEDFELQVSSPGLNESFRVKEQYLKNRGRRVEILIPDGTKIEGVLEDAGDKEITLKTTNREKVGGHKKKQLIVKKHHFKYDEIKSAKAVVSFK